jgi:beta-lactam-binding protein with PASTA domain
MNNKDQKRGNLISFLISKKFFIHLGIAIISIGILFLVFRFSMDKYTNHGNELVVPNFSGMNMLEVDSIGFTEDFDFFVIDSLFDESAKKGAIVIQDPLPGSKVKHGRNIYVTIVATMAEEVIMPDLRDLTLRQAVNVIEAAKLRVGGLSYEPSFDKNAVLEQFCKGDTVHPGDTIVKGSVIDLIIGTGDRLYKIPIPFLIGKTRDEAIYSLNIASFNLGTEFYMDTVMDESARVFMQEPRWDTDLSYFPGDSIHIWYKSDEKFDFETYLTTFSPDSLQTDSLMNDIIID